ncbi:MAG: thiamine pyrophosphate-binding protein [Candidatus Sericytochromatia bacterium]|nr:thiamine pyrophosphate-binding protein [Candidatus Sericytochromatia bacterium]
MAAPHTTRVADYVMQRLVEAGVQHVFVLPGGGAMHLNDALISEPRLQAVPCHHEQACGIAAEACGRTSAAGFGVALVTTGPGSTNVLTPVAGAWAESLPLLVISGQVKRAEAARASEFRQAGVQGVDIVSMAKPITKHAVTILAPEDVADELERALALMRSGRPGPVWLDLPLDVQAAPWPGRVSGIVPPVPTLGDLPIDWDALLARLARSERPLLLLGHGVRIAGAADAVRSLAERSGIPCAFTWNAADMLPYEHPLYVGRPGVVAARAPNLAVQSCDLLIAIGVRLDNVVTAYHPADFARQAHKVVVDVDPVELAKHPFSDATRVQADAREFVTALAARVKEPGPWEAWRGRCEGWKRRFDAIDGRPFPAEGPLAHFELVDALSELVPPDQLIVTGSSGLAVEVFYTVFRNKPGQRVFLTSGLGAMGYGLPAAIGACLGAQRRPTLAVESDGSLMLNLQELATLKQLDLPLVLLVLDNGGYASIRNTQANYFEGRFLAVDEASGLWLPDWVALAQAFGLPASRLRRGPCWRDELARALAHPGPSVCVVELVPTEVLAPKVSAMPQPDGSMVSMPLEDMAPLLPLAVLAEALDGRVAAQSLRVRGEG